MKRIITTLVGIFAFIQLFAEPVDQKRALKIANNWISNQSQNKSEKAIEKITEIHYKNVLTYYLIEYKNSGFIIISADDKAKPILAYSNENLLGNYQNNPIINNWLSDYKLYVYSAVNSQEKNNNSKYLKDWKNLEANIFATKSEKKEVAPMLESIKFSQGYGWNDFCPEDVEGTNGRAIVGCVATAMAQIIRFWEHPKQGKSTYSYIHEKYGKLTANFGETIYDWSNMSKIYPDKNNAKLLYQCGVSLDMNYGANSSGTSSGYVPHALKTFFRYDPTVKMIYKRNYKHQDWCDQMKAELNEKRPILYSGRSSVTKPAGHLFALDGYKITDQGDYFHINWGWAGNSNGYFYLTDMVTHGGNHNWIERNSAIINIKPINSAPEFISFPQTTVLINKEYKYKIATIDGDGDDVTIEIKETPTWLTVKKEGSQFILTGTPNKDDCGFHQVILIAKDRLKSVEQIFDILVTSSIKTIDFETGDLSQNSFSFLDDAKWEITDKESVSGKYSIKSQEIKDNKNVAISTYGYFNKGGKIYFDCKVSSEKKYDYLKFYIDNQEMGKWSGDIDWQKIEFNITEGYHNLKWTYEKDVTTSEGEDCAWLDNIIIANSLGSKNVLSTSSYSEDENLLENYPNPVNDITDIKFFVNEKTNVELIVFDNSGRRVKTLINKTLTKGNHNILFDASNLSSGVYLYQLRTVNKTMTRKMIVK